MWSLALIDSMSLIGLHWMKDQEAPSFNRFSRYFTVDSLGSKDLILELFRDSTITAN